LTERRLEAGPPWLVWRGLERAQLEQLHHLQLNFDPEGLPTVARDAWHVDDYCRSLRPEPPGEPVRRGPFEAAKLLLRDYEFADPTRLRAFYRADAPLVDRDMLLEIRYLGLRVRVGVRIRAVFDEIREVAGRKARVWGWAYGTLEGHLERGQMDYQVWKWLDTGEVEYRIHAVSEVAEIRNPILSIGFRLVGRREQVQFARRCGERMEQLVNSKLSGGRAESPPEGGTGIVVSPTSARSRRPESDDPGCPRFLSRSGPTRARLGRSAT
jgi:uncharacterized protein (UPF0548 family)